MDFDWPPFETIDDDGNPSGISVDISFELGKYLDIQIEIVDMKFNELIDALNNDEIDVIIAASSDVGQIFLNNSETTDILWDIIYSSPIAMVLEKMM